MLSAPSDSLDLSVVLPLSLAVESSADAATAAWLGSRLAPPSFVLSPIDAAGCSTAPTIERSIALAAPLSGLPTAPAKPVVKSASRWVVALSLLITTGLLFQGSFWLLNQAIDRLVQRDAEVQIRLEQGYQVTLDRLQLLVESGQHQACFMQAQTIPPQSRLYAAAQRYVSQCQTHLTELRLQQADRLAASDQIEAAIALVMQIPGGSEVPAIQARVDRLSERLWQWSQREYSSSTSPQYLNHVLYALEAIPPSSAFYASAQASKQAWQANEQQNQQHWQAAQAAIAAQDYARAEARLKQITAQPYWQQQVQSIAADVTCRRIAQEALHLLRTHPAWSRLAQLGNTAP